MRNENKNSTIAGFTIVEIMIVVAIIGILVAIAVPAFIRARKQSQAGACIENQIKVEGAVLNYALDTNTTVIAPTALLVGTEEYLQTTPRCPTTGLVVQAKGGTIETLITDCPTRIEGHVREDNL